jgi:hypothetical protein
MLELAEDPVTGIRCQQGECVKCFFKDALTILKALANG